MPYCHSTSFISRPQMNNSKLLRHSKDRLGGAYPSLETHPRVEEVLLTTKDCTKDKLSDFPILQEKEQTLPTCNLNITKYLPKELVLFNLPTFEQAYFGMNATDACWLNVQPSRIVCFVTNLPHGIKLHFCCWSCYNRYIYCRNSP